MDFLKNIALPASAEHYHVLVFLAAFCAIIFMLYTGVVLGTSLVSSWLERKARKEREPELASSALDLIQIPLYSKSVVLFFGILPGFSLVAAYAQLFKSTATPAVEYIGFGFLCSTLGLGLLYAYRYTLRLQNILESYQTLVQKKKSADQNAAALVSFSTVNRTGHQRMGRYGIAFLVLGIFLYSAALFFAGDPARWQQDLSGFDILVSGGVWLKFISALILSAGLTGFWILALAFFNERSRPYQTPALLRSCGTRLSIFSLVLFPPVLLANIANVSDMALSGAVFFLAGSAFAVYFLAAHFLYGFQQTGRPQAVVYGLGLFVLASGILIGSDYTGVGTATRMQSTQLSVENQKELDALNASLGVVTVKFTGEDIYNGRCSACHLFDQKKIGPPYLETIPKYKNDKAALVSFILNPVKKNPAYPPMPNQGLKPAEADSVANYVLRMVAQHSIR